MKAVKLIYGTEDYLMERDRRAFFEHWQEHAGSDGDIQRFTKDTDVSVVVEALESNSLFSAASLYIWNECPFLPVKRGGRSRSKLAKEEEWFLEKLALLSEGQAFLFFSKGNIDTACAFYKKLKPLADTAKYDGISDKEVMPYVEDYLSGQGRHLSPQGRRYLQGLFQTWEAIPLLYVFSELDKLCLSLTDPAQPIGEAQLEGIFSGTVEKNLFTFMDAFLRRDGTHAVPLMEGLFSRTDLFLKNTGYMISQLRNLRAYKELKAQHVGNSQCESILSAIQKGRNVKYLLYRLPKVEAYWTIRELDALICHIFTLQLNIRRGLAAAADMGPLICLYCHGKR